MGVVPTGKIGLLFLSHIGVATSGSIADKNRQIFIQTSHFCFSSSRKLVFVSIISSFYKFKSVSFRFVCKDSFVIV